LARVGTGRAYRLPVLVEEPQIDNLKLQKLLYYAQAWHLAIHDRPVFREPPVFREYRDLRWSPIPSISELHIKISAKLREHLDEA
jgi:uncharacterized phage-associated protein